MHHFTQVKTFKSKFAVTMLRMCESDDSVKMQETFLLTVCLRFEFIVFVLGEMQSRMQKRFGKKKGLLLNDLYIHGGLELVVNKQKGLCANTMRVGHH